jgi:adenosylhomocysteine nucleosidase
MILIVTAFDAEARPMIDHFRLRRQADHGFPVYAGDDVWLIVSGPGRINAAAATTHLHGRAGFPWDNSWINVGIAGHAELPLGEARIAHKITEKMSGKSWYPALVTGSPWKSAPLMTVDRPDMEYASGSLVDMEASAFMETALRFSSGEFVHVLKIVSDNRESPAVIPKGSQLQAWITPHVAALEDFCRSLERLAIPLETPAGVTQQYETLTAAMHFTVSQQNRLQQLLQRWQALNPDMEIPATVSGQATAQGLLDALQMRIDSMPPVFR